MPQLNPEFFVSQLFWLVVTFSFLLVFLWRISLPRIGSVLEKREKKINDDIATTKELQKKAESIQKIIEDKLRNARTETAVIIKTTSIDLQKKTASELVELDKGLDKKIDDSANDIEKNKNDSLNQIHDQIHEITKLIFSKITNFKVSNLDVKDAVTKVERKIH
jgi:F-type H+-transporting ATPase subunit b